MLMCRDLARIGSDYIDGKLRPTETVSVKMHLMMCKHCRSFIGNLRESVQLIKAHSDFRMDEGYATRIDEAINDALTQQRRK